MVKIQENAMETDQNLTDDEKETKKMIIKLMHNFIYSENEQERNEAKELLSDIKNQMGFDRLRKLNLDIIEGKDELNLSPQTQGNSQKDSKEKFKKRGGRYLELGEIIPIGRYEQYNAAWYDRPSPPVPTFNKQVDSNITVTPEDKELIEELLMIMTHPQVNHSTKINSLEILKQMTTQVKEEDISKLIEKCSPYSLLVHNNYLTSKDDRAVNAHTTFIEAINETKKTHPSLVNAIESYKKVKDENLKKISANLKQSIDKNVAGPSHVQRNANKSNTATINR